MTTEERIYLDHAATTATDLDVFIEMMPYFTVIFGNASSLHKDGRRAVGAIDHAREMVAKALGASSSEIYFTSGGTEADNWAVIGLAEANADKGRHIVASSVEHPAVLSALKRLSERGFEVTYLPVNAEGEVSVEDAVKAFRPDTVLVTLMLVNNEVGTVQPVHAVATEAHQRGILVHTDAVQAAGVFALDVNTLGVDALSISAHKFYGPKGAGALYVRKDTRIKGLIVGGEQERSLRGGTYNTPAIVGLGAAIERATANLLQTREHLVGLKTYFIKKLLELGRCRINGSRYSSSGIVNVLFYGVKNTELLPALDQAGIEASAGSACSSGSVEPSHVLTAMGLSEAQVACSVRFSFGKDNTFEQVDQTILTLSEILPHLMRDEDLFRKTASDSYDL